MKKITSQNRIKEIINEAIIGNTETFKGIALDAKGYACIKLKDENIIYIPEISSWNDDFFNKEIIIKGKFLEKKLILDPFVDINGAISQGSYGTQYTLENIEEIKLV